jgi:K(+)-stimulated pyrophosphate-energized sodium pump
LLAVELAVSLTTQQGSDLGHMLAGIFFLIALFFVHRSFYGMRIGAEKQTSSNIKEVVDPVSRRSGD